MPVNFLNYLACNVWQDDLLPDPHATPGDTDSEGPSSEQELSTLEVKKYSQDPDSSPVESESSEESDSAIMMMAKAKSAG